MRELTMMCDVQNAVCVCELSSRVCDEESPLPYPVLGLFSFLCDYVLLSDVRESNLHSTQALLLEADGI